MDYTSGTTSLAQQVDIYKSDAAQAGISIAVNGETFNTLLGVASPSNPNWTMVDISGWAYDGPGYLPTGEPSAGPIWHWRSPHWCGHSVRVGNGMKRPGGHPLPSLPRAWWLFALPGCRPADSGATYVRYDLDEQPDVPCPESLDWLEGEAEKAEWSISGEDASPVRPLTAADLEAVAGGLPVPPSLRLLAERPELQRRIRSATACYLDLGDFAASTAEDGYLIHVLSDQQWVRHWLLYLDARGGEAVLTCSQPVGFDLPADWPAPPGVIPVDGGELDLEVCAGSFAEFLYRFWVENEIYFTGLENQALGPAAAAYVSAFQ